MIKRKIGQKHSSALIVTSATTLLAPASALAMTPFELPFCPPVDNSNQSSSKTLEPIRLDFGNGQQESSQVQESSRQDDSSKQTKAAEASSKTAGSAPAEVQSQSKQRHVPSVFEKAQNANCVPLTLMPSRSETEENKRVLLDAQKNQLASLWTATIERSDDIQFVVKVLQPQTDQKHAVAKAMNLVGGALYSLGSTAVPGPARLGIGLGAPTLGNLFNQGDKGPQISVGETIVLYKMVRDIAETLVESYRNYRRVIAERDAARIDLSDLEKLRQSIELDGQPGTILQFEYTIKKADREALLSEERAELYRQKLLDLAGDVAVDKLDAQIEDERASLAKLIGRPDINPAITAPKSESAASTVGIDRNRKQ